MSVKDVIIEKNATPIEFIRTGLFVLMLSFVLLSHGVSSVSAYHLPFKKIILENGLTVILEEDHNTNLAAIQLWVRTGSCFEGEYQGSGITHLVEHMVFKGENTAQTVELSKLLQSLGGELDAGTSKEYTYYKIVAGSEHLTQILEILYGMFSNPQFVEEEINKEKEVVLREMDMVDDNPHKYLSELFFKYAFQGHPYGMPVIGYRQLFTQINKDDLEKYYKSRYIPENVILSVAGDIQTDEISQKIEKMWGSLPVGLGNYVPPVMPLSPNVSGPIKNIVKKKISSNSIMMGFYGPSIYDDDLYAMDVLAEIAGGSSSSHLVKKLRDEEGLVSYLSAWSFTPTIKGIWGISADAVNNDMENVCKNILKELYKYRVEYVGNRELVKAKKQVIREYLASLYSLEDRVSDLASNEYFMHNPDFSSQYVKRIQTVAKEDILASARKYFKKEGLNIMMLAPESSAVGIDSGHEAVRDMPISKKDLSNGIRVLVKEDSRVPLLNICVAMKGGLLSEQVFGSSYFLSKVWLKEYQYIVDKIESKGGSISSYSGNNTIGLFLQVFPEDLREVCGCLKELMSGLKITDDKMEIVRNIQLMDIKRENDNPYSFAVKNAKNLFYDKHPYGRSILGDENSIKNISSVDVEGFFKKCISTNDIVISIFGSCVSGEIYPTIEKDLSNIVSLCGESAQNKVFPQVERQIQDIDCERSMEEAISMIVIPSVSIYDKDRYAVDVLAQYFNGQAGLLYQKIREKDAKSYSVGAVQYIGIEQGVLIFYAAVQPEFLDQTKNDVFSIIKDFKQNGMSENDLERVKKYIVTQTQNNWEDVQNLSMEVTLDELYGLGVEYYKHYVEEINKVTVEDVKNAADKYLTVDNWYSCFNLKPSTEDKRSEKL